MKRKLVLARICTALLAVVLVSGPPLGLAQEMGQGIGKPKGRQKGSKAAAKSLTGEQKVFHLLDRITFGPRPGDFDRAMKMGWEKFLDEQLHPERISDSLVEAKLKNIESIHLSNAELAKYFPQPKVIQEVLKSKGIEFPPQGAAAQQDKAQDKAPGKAGDPAVGNFRNRREVVQALAEMGYKPPQMAIQELQQAKILRAVYSERQLQEVMTDFWFNHFNVYIQKGADRILTTSYERDVIRPRVFGKFEDLLKATAESPAMLFYLDNFMSAAPEGAQTGNRNRGEMRPPKLRPDRGFIRLNDMRRGSDRNIREGRRESQQMARFGNQDQIKRGRRGLNENYAREIMELHTLGVDGGYTQKDVQEVARCFTGWTLRNPRGAAEFVFVPAMHDDAEKTVLGKKISAGGGINDGYAVIHLLAMHPSTAKFISTKLARKFVADNPPQSLIDRMAQTFRKTDGDIRETLITLLKSPEFWAAENYRAKIKTPFEMTISAVRAIGAETNGGPQFHRWIAQMGEGLYLAQPPTGYPDSADRWVNTGALLERMNFALALSSNRIPGTRVNLSGQLTDSGQVMDQYLKLLLRGEVSEQTRTTIDRSLNEQQTATEEPQVDVARVAKVAKVIGLILGSPEFQRQ